MYPPPEYKGRTSDVCACDGSMPDPEAPEACQPLLAHVQILNIRQGESCGRPFLKFRARNFGHSWGAAPPGASKGAGCAISAAVADRVRIPNVLPGRQKVRVEPFRRLRVGRSAWRHERPAAGDDFFPVREQSRFPDTMKEPGSPRKVRLGACRNPSLRNLFQETPECCTSVSTNTSGS
jgi:hypothetical protein